MTDQAPRAPWRAVNGIVVLDKPVGMSSNTALQRVRRAYRAQKAGHTGSLDPLASGLLPICFGEATKVAGYLLDEAKTYEAVVRLGQRTDTGDLEGAVVEQALIPELTTDGVAAVLERFLGDQQQIPPMYSALKVEGQPLYRLARQGIEVTRKPRSIHIHSLRLLELTATDLRFEVHCSKGTYVRTLAEEVARALGTCGHLIALKRTKIGAHQSFVAHTLEQIESATRDALDHWLVPTSAGVQHWPRAELSAEEAIALYQGKRLSRAYPAETRYQLWHGEEFLGLGEMDELGQSLRSLRLMARSLMATPNGF